MSGKFRIESGDCRVVLPTIESESVDSCVTDPPYEISFMGKKWDANGIAYDVSMWAEVFRVLKPGSYLLAFGATRMYHRMVCAIEDAGFEIRDSIHWAYGQGMPKGMDIGKAIDKVVGAVTEEAKTWEGWNTALKPCHEPIVLARKPLAESTVVEQVLKTGTGALNINGCRVATISDDPIFAKNPHTVGGFGHAGAQIYRGQGSGAPTYDPSSGRFPPNFLLTHHPDCQCTGTRTVKTGTAYEPDRKEMVRAIYGKTNTLGRTLTYGSETGTEMIAEWDCAPGCPVKELDTQSDGTSRFFPVTSWEEADFDVFRYVAKASSKERGEENDHPTVKPVALMQWLVRLVTRSGGVVLDQFLGSGTTGIAALREGFEFIGIEKDGTYIPIAQSRIENYNGTVESKSVKKEKRKEPEPVPLVGDSILDLFS